MSDETFECATCRDTRQVRIDGRAAQPCPVCRPAAAVPEAQDGREARCPDAMGSESFHPRCHLEAGHDGPHERSHADWMEARIAFLEDENDRYHADLIRVMGERNARASAAVREGERERLAALHGAWNAGYSTGWEDADAGKAGTPDEAPNPYPLAPSLAAPEGTGEKPC